MVPESQNGLRCAIYIRVSTEEQHLNGLSLPAQRMALTEYAHANGCIVVGVYADEGISARKSMHYRKALLRLLEEVKAGKIDMILVTKLDRWFRNIKDYHLTEEILQKHRCHWKTIFEHYDSSTANGQMVINIMLSVNQAECDRTSERIKAVMDYKRTIGEVTSGRCACYGYKVALNRLVKDEAVSHIIEEAYRYYFICFSIRRTVSHIQDMYGEVSPSAWKIERLFKNETYAGKDQNNLNYCEPYLPLLQFQEIQRISQAKLIPGQQEDVYLFSSLIICPVCGGHLTGYRRKHRCKNGTFSIYSRYRCCRKYSRHPSACLDEKKLEAYLTLAIWGQDENSVITFQCRRPHRKNPPEASNVREEMQRLNIQFQKGRITETYYDGQYQLLQSKLSLCNTNAAEIPPEDFSGSTMALYRTLDRQHRKAFWKSLLSEITVDPDTHQPSGFSFHTTWCSKLPFPTVKSP